MLLQRLSTFLLVHLGQVVALRPLSLMGLTSSKGFLQAWQTFRRPEWRHLLLGPQWYSDIIDRLREEPGDPSRLNDGAPAGSTPASARRSSSYRPSTDPFPASGRVLVGQPE